MTTIPSRVPPIPAGLTPDEQTAAINDRLRRMAAEATTTAASSATVANSQPGVPSAPGTPVATAGRLIGLQIATTAPVTAQSITASIAVTPALTNAPAAGENITYWYSDDGGRQLFWLNWQPYYGGKTTAVNFTAAVPTPAQAGNLTVGNFIVYAAMGAIAGSATAAISLSALPAGYVASNALTLLYATPAPVGLTAALTNVQGLPATEANIQFGVGPAQNPYAEVNITLTTPGAADPTTASYTIGLLWTDASGNPINEGGLANPAQGVWQKFVEGIPNNGLVWQGGPLQINYPAPGVDGYLSWYIWGVGANASTTGLLPPFTGNPGMALAACWNGETYFRLHVGPPPASLTGFGLGNQQSLGNPAGVPTTTTSNPAVSIVSDANFAFDPLGALSPPSSWAVSGAAGGVTIRNDGAASTAGVQNYARIPGGLAIYTNLIVPTGQSLYFAYAARSNNPAVTIVISLAQATSATGTRDGTYYNVPLNGAGGTGALCTLTIVNNVITWSQVTAPGSGYLSNTNFTVSVTAAGGSGLSVKAFTAYHEVLMSITAYDGNLNVVNVNGAATNTLTVQGSVSAWEITAASGFLLFPANVASVHLAIGTASNEPSAGYWDITNIVVQTAQNQTASGQTNSQYPQVAGGGVTALTATAAATAQQSIYGLGHIELIGTASEFLSIDAGGGEAGVSLSSATGYQVGLVAENAPLAEFFLGTPGGTHSIVIQAGPSGISITIDGHTGFTGATAGRSSFAGLVI